MFTIGELIGTASIFLAFSQLIRPVILLRLYTGWLKPNTAKLLLICSTGMVFFSAIISSTSVKYYLSELKRFFPLLIEIPHFGLLDTPIIWQIETHHLRFFNDPIIWQVAAGLIMMVVIIRFMYKIFRPAKFYKGNDDIYLKICHKIIASGVEKDLNELASEIERSILPIFSKAHQVTENRKSKILSKGAYDLLLLFSEENFCKVIVNHHPKTLFNIFIAAKKYNGNMEIPPLGLPFIHQLIRLLFTEETSLLYREKKNEGLDFLETLKAHIFYDVNFTISQYYPLRVFMYYRYRDWQNITGTKIEKFFEIFVGSLRSYLTDGYDLCLMSEAELKRGKFYVEKNDNSLRYQFIDPTGQIQTGMITQNKLGITLNKLSERNLSDVQKIFPKVLALVSKQENPLREKRKNQHNLYWGALDDVANIIVRLNRNLTDHLQRKENLSACHMGLSLLISQIDELSDHFPEGEFTIDEENYDFFKNDNNIYGALAKSIYTLLEKLSMIPENNESIHTILVHIYNLNNSTAINRIKIRITTLLKQQIIKNLVELQYPLVTASLIYSFGLCEPEKISNNPLHQFLMASLKKHFYDLYCKDNQVALDMLPLKTTLVENPKRLSREITCRPGDTRQQTLLLE